MAKEKKEAPATLATNLTGEQLREVEQLGFGPQGQLEPVRADAEEHEGIAVIDIATGKTLKEERLPEPPENPTGK